MANKWTHHNMQATHISRHFWNAWNRSRSILKFWNWIVKQKRGWVQCQLLTHLETAPVPRCWQVAGRRCWWCYSDALSSDYHCKHAHIINVCKQSVDKYWKYFRRRTYVFFYYLSQSFHLAVSILNVIDRSETLIAIQIDRNSRCQRKMQYMQKVSFQFRWFGDKRRQGSVASCCKQETRELGYLE